MLSEQNQIALTHSLSRPARSVHNAERLLALDFRQSAPPLPEGEVLHTLCLLHKIIHISRHTARESATFCHGDVPPLSVWPLQACFI